MSSDRQNRIRRRFLIFHTVLVAVSLAIAGLVSESGDWAPTELLAALWLLTLICQTGVIRVRDVEVTPTFIGLILAMALLGPAPAVVIGVSCMVLDGGLRWRGARRGLTLDAFAQNLASFASFPLVGGFLFEWVVPRGSDVRSGLGFAGITICIFLLMNVINFVQIIGPVTAEAGGSLREAFKRFYLPVLAWEIATAVLTGVAVFGYQNYGIGAVALMSALILVFQYLLQSVVAADQRRDALERSYAELETLQEGMLSVLLRTLTLRDRMTARHSAAVAELAREAARRAGLPERDQQLAHIAGLLHDIGKFSFPDSVLFAGASLGEEQLAVVRRHPALGASAARRVRGFDDVADIIENHHERVDGRGYPNGRKGDEIPFLARIVAVAEAYDALTAADSYRDPVSHEAAIAILEQGSGTQFDPRAVELVAESLSAGFDLPTETDPSELEAKLRFGHSAVVRPA